MKLPDQEWNFGTLPEEQTHCAFLYEYSRECELIQELVEQRRKEQELTDRVRRSRNRTANLATNRKLQAMPTDHWQHHLSAVVFWLAGVQQFPDAPWQSLPDAVREKGHELATYPLNGQPAAQTLDWWLRESLAMPHQSLVLINWRSSNTEILESLQRLRPKGFPDAVRTGQRGVDGNKLPFRKLNALDWLGIRRRRESVRTWREFGTVYLGKLFEEDDDRPYQAHARKAALILQWFADQTPRPFDPADFK